MKNREIISLAAVFLSGLFLLFGCNSETGSSYTETRHEELKTTYSLSGTVTVREIPSAGAKVEIDGASGYRKTVTDEYGHYTFSSLNPGTHIVSASGNGCTAETKKILINKSEMLNLNLGLPLTNRCFGGNSADSGYSCVAAEDGTILITGSTNSKFDKNTDIPSSKHESLDLWVLKIDPSKPQDRQIIYNRCFGGSEDEEGRSIASCPDGTILVTGYTNSPHEEGGDIPASKHSLNDMWVLKIDPSKPQEQQIIYNRCFGGSYDDEGKSIVSCPDGTFLVAGVTSSPEEPNTDIPESKHGHRDMWVLKIDPSKPHAQQIVYNRCFGGELAESACAVAYCNDGSFYVAGSTDSNIGDGDIPDSRHIGTDMWLLKVDPSKMPAEQITYNRCFGGNMADSANSMALADDGTVLLAGFTDSEAGDGGDSPGTKGQMDLWVLKIDTSQAAGNQILYNRSFGGESDEFAYSIAPGEKGTILVAGHTESAPKDGDIPESKKTGADMWIIKIDPAKQQLMYNRCFGGKGHDYGYSCFSGGNGTVTALGTTNSPQEQGTDIPPRYRGKDLWLMKIDTIKNTYTQTEK